MTRKNLAKTTTLRSRGSEGLAPGWVDPTECANKPIQRPFLPPSGKGAFPNPQHTPAFFTQGTVNQFVAILVRKKFAPPESSVMDGQSPVLRTPMPETAIHKNCELEFLENEIRLYAKDGARCSVRSGFRFASGGAQRTARPATNLHLPPAAGNAMPHQQLRQRQFRPHVTPATGCATSLGNVCVWKKHQP